MKTADGTIRHDWTIDEIVDLHELPLLELVGHASAVHRQHHNPNAVQKASLLSIKTGGCPETVHIARSLLITARWIWLVTS
jgi:biotin synthase